MPYGQFTMSSVTSKFGLTIGRTTDLFADVAEVELSPELTIILRRFVPMGLGLSTEKGRSELLIAPILFELRSLYPDRVSVFSGVEFNVDESAGLKGRCDFVVSRSPEQYQLTAPVCVLVEAKTEDIIPGLGQCLAEMVAAQKFNRDAGATEGPIFGVVSSGKDWRFLKLERTEAWIDIAEYPIQNPRKIFGILTLIALGPS